MRKQSTLYRSGLIINEVNFNLNCTFYCIFVSCSEPKKCPCVIDDLLLRTFVLECIIAAISTLFLLNSLSINLLFDSRGNIFLLFEVP